jgi:predicted Ser/Thr protein kinase
LVIRAFTKHHLPGQVTGIPILVIHYTIPYKDNESDRSLSKKHGLSKRDTHDENPQNKDWDTIPNGAHLALPEKTPSTVSTASKGTSFIQHTLKHGESDWTLSKKYGVSEKDIHDANPQIKDWNSVPNGTQLRIPVKKSGKDHRGKVLFSLSKAISHLLDPDADMTFSDHLYTKLDKIGEGGGGVIYRVQDNKTKRIYILKKGRYGNCKREAQILKDLAYSGVTPKVYAYDSNNIVMDYVEGEQLNKVASKIKNTPLKRDLLLQLAKAIQFLQKQNYVHLDLHFGNWIINKDLRKITLIDFDGARRPNDGHGASGWNWVTPPESRKNPKQYDLSADIWGLGMNVYSLWSMIQTGHGGSRSSVELNAAQFGKSAEEAKRLYFEKNEVLFPLFFGSELKALIKQMTHTNPSTRPGIDEVVQRLSSMKL